MRVLELRAFERKHVLKHKVEMLRLRLAKQSAHILDVEADAPPASGHKAGFPTVQAAEQPYRERPIIQPPYRPASP